MSKKRTAKRRPKSSSGKGELKDAELDGVTGGTGGTAGGPVRAAPLPARTAPSPSPTGGSPAQVLPTQEPTRSPVRTRSGLAIDFDTDA